MCSAAWPASAAGSRASCCRCRSSPAAPRRCTVPSMTAGRMDLMRSTYVPHLRTWTSGAARWACCLPMTCSRNAAAIVVKMLCTCRMRWAASRTRARHVHTPRQQRPQQPHRLAGHLGEREHVEVAEHAVGHRLATAAGRPHRPEKLRAGDTGQSWEARCDEHDAARGAQRGVSGGHAPAHRRRGACAASSGRTTRRGPRAGG